MKQLSSGLVEQCTCAHQPPLALLPSCLLCVGVREHSSLASMSKSSTSIFFPLHKILSWETRKHVKTVEEEKYVLQDRKFPGSQESTHAGILFSFRTGSCSWPLTLKIIGFICTELFFFPHPIFQPKMLTSHDRTATPPCCSHMKCVHDRKFYLTYCSLFFSATDCT